MFLQVKGHNQLYKEIDEMQSVEPKFIFKNANHVNEQTQENEF